MHIIIDQGNTSAKVAFFENRGLVVSFRFKPLKEEDMRELLSRFSPDKGILCCVGKTEAAVIDMLRKSLSFFIELNTATPLPIKMEYRTPDTLGKDRIAAVTGAYLGNEGRNLLVIDAGTAITYDFITADGIYKGGNISPGMTIRFRALHNNTSKLPMLDENGDIPPLGYDTETAIRAGVVQGIVREMDSYIEEYQKNHNVLAFLTGGHSFYFAKQLKSSIFADGNLVLKGLNEILMYQYA